MQHFDQELDALKEILLTMASKAEAAVNNALKALVDRDDDLARSVKEEDNAIDQLEIEVDEMAIGLLSKAPLASDLRLITVAMKISHDLERVGDEATTISRRAVELGQEPHLKPYIDFPRMPKMALEMLDHALAPFAGGKPKKARQA